LGEMPLRANVTEPMNICSIHFFSLFFSARIRSTLRRYSRSRRAWRRRPRGSRRSRTIPTTTCNEAPQKQQQQQQQQLNKHERKDR